MSIACLSCPREKFNTSVAKIAAVQFVKCIHRVRIFYTCNNFLMHLQYIFYAPPLCHATPKINFYHLKNASFA